MQQRRWVDGAPVKAMGLIDKIINEPLGGAHRDPKQMCSLVKRAWPIHCVSSRVLKLKIYLVLAMKN
jgi:acetyl-CoA carboxylase alpha subunit